MGVLTKKVKGSTLMETLVATVLIVIVFMMASMVLNTLFASTLIQNDQSVRQQLTQLQYHYEHGLLEVPYYEKMGVWELNVNNVNWKEGKQVEFSAVHESSKKEIVMKLIDGHD